MNGMMGKNNVNTIEPTALREKGYNYYGLFNVSVIETEGKVRHIYASLIHCSLAVIFWKHSVYFLNLIYADYQINTFQTTSLNLE